MNLMRSADILTGKAALQALIATTMTFGVANRVLYKMALVPLGDYVFFLAQFQTFGYEPVPMLMEGCLTLAVSLAL